MKQYTQYIYKDDAWRELGSSAGGEGTVTSVTLQATSPIAVDDDTAITSSGVRTLSHVDSGVTAGTYKSVTVDAKGHVTAGSNPTTLSGYGITDAKINNGVVTLGSNTITPLTTHQNTFSKVKVGSTNVEADAAGDTLELVAGSNVTLTPDATNDKVTIAATDTTYTDGTAGYVLKAKQDKDGNQIDTTYYKASNPSGYTSNTGTVTKVTAGAGLNTTSNDTSTDGGDITSTGTLHLTKSGVTAGTYQGLTVDKYGRVTGASNMGYTTNTGTITSVKMNGSTISSSGEADLGTVITDISGKQDTLVSGTNIKTINNESILGSGDLHIASALSDWDENDNTTEDYVKNRTHYREEDEFEQQYYLGWPDEEVSPNYWDGLDEFDYWYTIIVNVPLFSGKDLAEGQSISVTLNGTTIQGELECDVYEGGRDYYIGNYDFEDAANPGGTGERYLLTVSVDEDNKDEPIVYLFFTKSNSPFGTIDTTSLPRSLILSGTMWANYHKLDVRYLPDECNVVDLSGGVINYNNFLTDPDSLYKYLEIGNVSELMPLFNIAPMPTGKVKLAISNIQQTRAAPSYSYTDRIAYITATYRWDDDKFSILPVDFSFPYQYVLGPVYTLYANTDNEGTLTFYMKSKEFLIHNDDVKYHGDLSYVSGVNYEGAW